MPTSLSIESRLDETYHGSGTIKDGYRYLFRPRHPNAHAGSGWVAEHRLVMAEKLGRPLEQDEEVHHKNGNRLDNRLENLEIWVTSRGKHRRGAAIEGVVAHAVEMLERYAPERLKK